MPSMILIAGTERECYSRRSMTPRARICVQATQLEARFPCKAERIAPTSHAQSGVHHTSSTHSKVADIVIAYKVSKGR